MNFVTAAEATAHRPGLKGNCKVAAAQWRPCGGRSAVAARAVRAREQRQRCPAGAPAAR
jgi:hypothetical protein